MHGPGILIMNFFWIIEGSIIQPFSKIHSLKSIILHNDNHFSGEFVIYHRETYLWSLNKKRWLSESPKLPISLGVEEGCLTLLNRTTVLIVGITKLESKY